MRNNKPWIDVYRPQKIDDCVLPDHLTNQFKAFLREETIPNLILSGPSGVGKTTVAYALLKEYGCDYIKINASLKRGIDIIKDEVLQFASSSSMIDNKKKYIIFDEADGLTSIAQESLKSFIEEFSDNCFHKSTKILTIEYGAIEIGLIVDKEVTIKSVDGVWRKVKIKNYGKQDIYKINFGKFNSSEKNIHQEVLVTKNHKWFLHDNSTTTNLSINDKLLTNNKIVPKNLNGIIHGMIFGDGTGHKSYIQNGCVIPKQGNKYATIRLCKQDKLQKEMFDYLVEAGYEPKYPISSNGDPTFYLGYIPYVKDLPFTNDPEYLSGFIYGWWLADGKKDHRKNLKISTIRKDAADWLRDNAAYSGYVVTGLNISSSERKGAYKNSKDLYNITLSSDYVPCVRSIEFWGNDDVFCLEEPITKGFTLANGLITGNCGFIFTCNNISKIDVAIQSRCQIIHFNLLNSDFLPLIKEFYVKLEKIFEENDVTVDKKTVGLVIKKYYPDWRKTIIILQNYSLLNNTIDVGILSNKEEESDLYVSLIEYLKNKKWNDIRKWVGENFYITSDFISFYKRLTKQLEPLINNTSLPILCIRSNEFDIQNTLSIDKETNVIAYLTRIMSEVVFK
jgi:DNA polymerase III delta prime subunit